MELDLENAPKQKPTAQERDEFLLDCMDQTAMILGLDLSDERKAGYLHCLRTQNPKALRYAFNQAIVHSKIHTFPLPGELLEWCRQYFSTSQAVEDRKREETEAAERFKRQKRLGSGPASKELVSIIELQNTPEWKEAMKTTQFKRPAKHQSREQYEDRMRMLEDQRRLLRGNG